MFTAPRREMCAEILSESHYLVSEDEKSRWHETLSAAKLMSDQLRGGT